MAFACSPSTAARHCMAAPSVSSSSIAVASSSGSRAAVPLLPRPCRRHQQQQQPLRPVAVCAAAGGRPASRTTAAATAEVVEQQLPQRRPEYSPQQQQQQQQLATTAVGSTIRYRVRTKGAAVAVEAGSGRAGQQQNPVSDFLSKLRLAWNIFFPEGPPSVKPKEEAKQRLRMILVADRCGMSPAGLTEMKRNILTAIEEFVDIESEEHIDVSITSQPDVGTVYCVQVPIRRVKPEARLGLGADGSGVEDVTFDVYDAPYDPDDPHSDPSSQFPYGT